MLVYIAEDDTPFADVLAHFLGLSGHRAKVFADGRRLVAALGEHAPDVLLLDVILPGLDGPSVLSWISLHCKHLPVVIISGLPSFGYAGAPVRLAGYLVKPFDGADLLQLLDRLQHSSRTPSPPPSSTTTPDGPTTQFLVPQDEETP